MAGVWMTAEPAPDDRDVRWSGRVRDSRGRDTVVAVPDAVTEHERTGDGPRWVWPATTEIYPDLLRRGITVGRCHDLALTEGVLLASVGRGAEPRGLGGAVARLRGLPAPPDTAPRARDTQPVLFDAAPVALPGGVDPLDAVVAVYADQAARIAADEHPDRLRLLVAAESAGSLAAVEMTEHGVPWSADVHRDLLIELLGPRPVGDGRPAVLAELADQIAAALGSTVDPDRPVTVLAAFRRAGIEIATTRAVELRGVDHPAIAPLLRYKELYRLYVAHGWSWLQTWVQGGRFRPEYVVGGVVSGRWASRGGAALQLPRVIRRAVVADPGWVLVVADAAQLEPRVLAALSGDRGMAAAASAGDLYRALADVAFDGDRDRAKVGMLSVMYGATAGEAATLTAELRRRYPVALDYVDAAATDGERGRRVRSRLGRTSPDPSWMADQTDDSATRRRLRDWGRFTRNFVVQASAADWASVFLAGLRTRLRALDRSAELVFFQHDEIIVHCPAELADAVIAAVHDAGAAAGELVFPGVAVRFPLGASAVACYADAK